MKTCPACNRSIPDYAVKCKYCDTRLVEQTSEDGGPVAPVAAFPTTTPVLVEGTIAQTPSAYRSSPQYAAGTVRQPERTGLFLTTIVTLLLMVPGLCVGLLAADVVANSFLGLQGYIYASTLRERGTVLVVFLLTLVSCTFLGILFLHLIWRPYNPLSVDTVICMAPADFLKFSLITNLSFVVGAAIISYTEGALFGIVNQRYMVFRNGQYRGTYDTTTPFFFWRGIGYVILVLGLIATCILLVRIFNALFIALFRRSALPVGYTRSTIARNAGLGLLSEAVLVTASFGLVALIAPQVVEPVWAMLNL